MKKHILLFLLFTGFLQAQTYPVNPTKFGKISLNTNGVSTSTTKINTQESDGQINYIDAVNLPVPTSVTNAIESKTENSAGAIQGFAVTNNGNGTVNIATGTAFLRATNDQYAPLVKYTIPAVTNLALTDNANNYVLVDYNGGSPALTVTTNSATINTTTNSLAILISRVGTTLDYLSLVSQNNDANAKIRIRFLNQEGIRRANGAIIGFASRNLTLTAGTLFSGLIRINSPAFNTSSPDTFTYVYNNGAVWTRVTGQTQVNNTQYNNAGTLTTMPSNDFRVDYIYLLPNNPSKLYVVYGSSTYNNITLARNAPTPTALPSELQVLGVLVGRQIIQKDAVSISEVTSAFTDVFAGVGVPEHNALAGLQGGGATDRQHLSTDEKLLTTDQKNTSFVKLIENNLAIKNCYFKKKTDGSVYFAVGTVVNGEAVQIDFQTDVDNFTRIAFIYTNTLSGNIMNETGRKTLSSSVLEFAINGRGLGDGLSNNWIPNHTPATAGAIINLTTSIYIDGILTNVTAMSATDFICNEVVIVQTYQGANVGSATPLWEGVTTHKFKDGKLSVSNTLKALQVVEMFNGYSAKITGYLANTPLLAFDDGSKITPAATGNNIFYDKSIKSSIFYSNTYAVAVEVSNIPENISYGKAYYPGVNKILFWDRATTPSVYWQWLPNIAGGVAGTGTVLPIGTILSSNNTIIATPNILKQIK